MSSLRIRTWRLVTMLVLAVSMPALVYGQEKSSSGTTGTIGLRAGFSLEPDQFVLGGQVALGKKLGIARIVPSVDVGFGNEITTIAFNADAQFRLNVEDSKVALYLGAGPTVLYYDPEGGNSAWELGLSLLAGIRLPLGGFPPTSFEARFGVGDIPDFKGIFVLEI